MENEKFNKALMSLGYGPMNELIMDVAAMLTSAEDTHYRRVTQINNDNLVKAAEESFVINLGENPAKTNEDLPNDFLKVRLTEENKYKKRMIVPAILGNLAVGSELSHYRSLCLTEFIGDDRPQREVSSFTGPLPLGRSFVFLDNSTSFSMIDENRQHTERAAELIGRAIDVVDPAMVSPLDRALY